ARQADAFRMLVLEPHHSVALQRSVHCALDEERNEAAYSCRAKAREGRGDGLIDAPRVVSRLDESLPQLDEPVVHFASPSATRTPSTIAARPVRIITRSRGLREASRR